MKTSSPGMTSKVLEQFRYGSFFQTTEGMGRVVRRSEFHGFLNYLIPKKSVEIQFHVILVERKDPQSPKCACRCHKMIQNAIFFVRLTPQGRTCCDRKSYLFSTFFHRSQTNLRPKTWSCATRQFDHLEPSHSDLLCGSFTFRPLGRGPSVDLGSTGFVVNFWCSSRSFTLQMRGFSSDSTG